MLQRLGSLLDLKPLHPVVALGLKAISCGYRTYCTSATTLITTRVQKK
jgi:hypothetical protein